MGKRKEKKLNPKAEQLALALASGMRLAVWARENGVNERTARTWAATPEFSAEHNRLRERIVTETVDLLSSRMIYAAGTLVKLLTSADERIKLRAAVEILSISADMRANLILEERVNQLERRAAESAE